MPSAHSELFNGNSAPPISGSAARSLIASAIMRPCVRTSVLYSSITWICKGERLAAGHSVANTTLNPTERIPAQ